MPLLPRWQYMTDESKSMVKKVGFSALAMIFVMGIVRALLPLAVVGRISCFLKFLLLIIKNRRNIIN